MGRKYRLRFSNDKLRKAEQDLIVLNNKISKSGLDDENFIQLELERDQLLDKKKILEREYNEKLNEKEKNSIEGNRTEANECFFILKTKLYNITEANGLLSQLDVLQREMFKYIYTDINDDWLGKNNDLLMKEYYKFKAQYIEEENNNIPMVFLK